MNKYLPSFQKITPNAILALSRHDRIILRAHLLSEGFERLKQAAEKVNSPTVNVRTVRALLRKSMTLLNQSDTVVKANAGKAWNGYPLRAALAPKQLVGPEGHPIIADSIITFGRSHDKTPSQWRVIKIDSRYDLITLRGIKHGVPRIVKAAALNASWVDAI